MANPSVTTLVDFTRTLLAENVASADVHILDSSKDYYWTYRETGGTTPTMPTDRYSVAGTEWLFWRCTLEVRPTANSDIYAFSIGAGKVRVDA